MDPITKARIDEKSYEQLLKEHRRIPPGDPRFQGEEGEYRVQRLAELRRQIPLDEQVAASKRVGF